MVEIRINLNRAMEQADELDKAAKDLQKELGKLFTAKQSLQSYWDSNASGILKTKLNDQYTELYQLCRQIEDVSETIRVVAERIKQNEESAKSRAQKL